MPSFSRGNDGLDKEYFEELQEKCRFLGISLKEKDFRKNPDKYIEAARSYDERVKDYLHSCQDRLKSLQEQFAREDNIPAFMALGKARMVLTGEVHRQMLAEKMAETAFAKIEEEYDFSVKDLRNKRNRDKFERLAYAFAISPKDLANQLQDAGNIGEALKNSDYQKELLQLAFDNDAVKTAAEAMAAFSPLHPSNGTLMLQAARDEAGRIRFTELQAAAETTAERTATTAAGNTATFDRAEAATAESPAKTATERTAAATIRNAAGADKTGAADRTPVSDRTAAQPENAAAAGEKKAAKLLAEFARYKDNQNGRSLLEQNAKALNKKANFVYLERTLDTFGLHGQAAKDFRMALSRHKGSLKDFLEHYEQAAVSSRQNQTTNSASRNNERQSDAYAPQPADRQRIQEPKQQKQTRRETEKQRREEEKQRRAAIKQQQEEMTRQHREAEKQHRKELKQQQKEAARQRRETEKKHKEAEKQRRKELKQQQKALRKARFRSWLGRLKSWAGREKQAIVETIAAVCHSASAPVKMTAEKARKLFAPKRKEKQAPKQAVKMQPVKMQPAKTAEGLELGTQQKIRTITLNIENYKTQKRQEKKAKIIEFKQKVREKSQKTLKYAAISIPLVGMGYLGFKGIQNAGPAFDLDKISMTSGTFTLPQEVLDKAATYYASVNEAFGFQTQDFSITEPDLSWSAFMNPPEQPINEADYEVPVPLVQNDKLHNVPNIDFFNLCFSKSNEAYGSGGKYGVSRELYAKFMRNQKATANFYRVGGYGSLSFDEARIIAKTEIFDKYGIAYIQNRSMGAYLYYALMKNQDKGGSVAAIASTITDFYDLNGKTLPDSQRRALENLSLGRDVNAGDWHEMIAAINATASDQTQENNLYAAIQQSQFNMPVPYDAANAEEIARQAVINSSFAYEPTLDLDRRTGIPMLDNEDFNLFADNPFLTEISHETANTDNEKEIMEAQKQKDMETFCKIYAQCSYNNVIRLSYGEKRQAFDAANKALARQGIYGKIDRGLYCAGMSMASFCQAYEIFKKENPESFVGEAVGSIIEKCKISAHSTTGMRDIYKKYSNRIIYSENLERDIKDHMRNHPNSILQSGFRRNAAGNQHYNGFFPSMNTASQDAYTYCAFNNNHWGNENTFSNVLRDRRRARFGKGGWYVDVTAWIDDEADTRIRRELEKRAELRQKLEPVSLPAITQHYFNNISTLLNKKLSGRN